MNKKDVIRFGFADYSLRSSASSLSTLRKFSALPAAQRRAELNVVFSRILHPAGLAILTAIGTTLGVTACMV